VACDNRVSGDFPQCWYKCAGVVHEINIQELWGKG
jgi:hypothetical protein